MNRSSSEHCEKNDEPAESVDESADHFQDPSIAIDGNHQNEMNYDNIKNNKDESYGKTDGSIDMISHGYENCANRISRYGFSRISFIVLFLIIIILMLGSFFFRDIIWDGFLWKYFAGPVYADAEDEKVDDISEGYNPVNTLIYGLILAWTVYWIYSLFREKGIHVDSRFTLMVIPYILLGSVLRVLEDAQYFSEPWVYIMISPIIYITIGLFTLAMVFLCIRIQEIIQSGKLKRARYMYHTTIWSFGLFYILLYLFLQESFVHLEHPILPIILLAFLTYFIESRSDRPSPSSLDYDFTLFSSIGVFMLFVALYHLCWWGFQESEGLLLHTIPQTLLLTIIAWALTMGFLILLNKKRGFQIETGVMSMNSLMIFSQFLDGAATFMGIDFHGYSEKHVIPSYLIDITGTAAIMFILKFLVLFLAIYILDVEYKKEMKQLPDLGGLIRLVVIILGLAPGTRDMLRLAFNT